MLSTGIFLLFCSLHAQKNPQPHFVQYTTQDGLPSSKIHSLLEDSRGYIWIGTDNGASRFDGYEFKNYGANEGMTRGIVLNIVEDIKGRIWFESSTGEAFKYDFQSDTIVSNKYDCLVKELELAKRNSNELDGKLPCILESFNFGEDAEFQIIENDQTLVTWGYYVHCIYNSKFIWSSSFSKPIAGIFKSSNENILLSHNNGMGVSVFSNLDSLKKASYTTYLNGYSISKHIEDKNHGLWFASPEDGIFYCPNPEMLIYDERYGLPNKSVVACTFKNENEIFVGNFNGYISTINIAENEISNSITRLSMHDNYILHYDSYQKALYEGFCKWDGNSWIWPERQIDISGSLEKIRLYDLDKIIKVSPEEYYGVNKNGIHHLDGKNNFVSSPLKSIGDKETYSIYKNSNDQIWVGNESGLHYLVDSQLVKNPMRFPILNKRIEDIQELDDGKLVLGIEGDGIALWKDNEIFIFGDEDGLPANMIEDIYVDNNNTIWVATLNGLSKINFDSDGNYTTRTFTVSHGLPANEIYRIESYGDQMWLCTAGGLVKFNEPSTAKEVVQPNILSVSMNSSLIQWKTDNEFTYEHNNCVIRFSAINHSLQGNIWYRYRISNQAEWQQTKNRTAIYTSLIPMEYAFEVQSKNEDEFWSESSIYSFTIKPPWWQTKWFSSFVILTLGYFGYLIAIYRNRRFKKELEIKRHLDALEKSALQAQMNPHFIFNCLNSIQNFILKNEKKKAVQYLARFAKLVRSQLQASVDGKINLTEEIGLLDNYLALEQERFNNSFEYNIIASEDLDPITIEIPPSLIQPFVENAIVHGLEPNSKNGKVSVGFCKIGDDLVVKIRDNGSGIQTQNNSKTIRRHKSLGSKLTQRRLTLINDQNNEPIQYKNLINELGEIEGTEVTLKINQAKS